MNWLIDHAGLAAWLALPIFVFFGLYPFLFQKTIVRT